jgi:hypothetical protein
MPGEAGQGPEIHSMRVQSHLHYNCTRLIQERCVIRIVTMHRSKTSTDKHSTSLACV